MNVLNFNKFLAGFLAMVLVAGLGTPVFAQTSFSNSSPIDASTEVFAPQHGNADQSFVGPFDILGGGFATSQQLTGQTFTASEDNLVGVDLFLYEFSGLSETVTVTIRDVDLFGPALGTTSMVVNLVPGTTLANPQVVHFDFIPSITLIPGQTYGIQFEDPDPNTFLGSAGFGNPYLGGSAFQSSIEFANIDFGFVTYFEDDVVGGEIIPIETTSLLLASAQSTSWMIPLVLSILGIGLFVVSRNRTNDLQ